LPASNQNSIIMQHQIRENVGNPQRLEELYRSDKSGFEEAFAELYPEISHLEMATFWKARFDYGAGKQNAALISRMDLFYVALSCAVAGFLIKLPDIIGFDAEATLFYQKNAGLIVFFGLSLFALLKRDLLDMRLMLVSFAVFVLSAIYINLLPAGWERDSIVLAYLHLPLLMWCYYGFIFIGDGIKEKSKRMDFVKYNGDLAILLPLIAIAGGILTAVTIGLFSAIDLNIEQFYFENVVIVGAVSAPVVATWIIREFPSVAGKIAPIIANIFSPLVLITLVVYLVSIVITGKDPYNDRDFLIAFNLLLVGVMAIIVFGVSGLSDGKAQRFAQITLLALVIVTLIVDIVALSAIVYRLGEYGFTPNRTVVLGSNLLIFGNLALIMVDLYRANFKAKEIQQVETTIAAYLPIYAVWTIFVVFAIPLIFGMR